MGITGLCNYNHIGFCATHLKIVGLLTPFAALQVWQSAPSPFSQFLYHWKLSLAALVAYVMLKQHSTHNQRFSMNSKPWFTLGVLLKVGTHSPAQDDHLFHPTSATYTFPGTTLCESSLILQQTASKASCQHTSWMQHSHPSRIQHALITSHLQLPEKAASWQLHGLHKALQSEPYKDNKHKKVLN